MSPVSLSNHMSKYDGHLGNSSTLAFVNNVVMNMGIQISLPGTNFLSCRHMPRSKVSESSDNSILLLSGSSKLFSIKAAVYILACLYFLLIDILINAR